MARQYEITAIGNRSLSPPIIKPLSVRGWPAIVGITSPKNGLCSICREKIFMGDAYFFIDTAVYLACVQYREVT